MVRQHGDFQCMSRHGFTLIEVLVVISIIAILIGLLLPALAAARQVAMQAKNATQIRNVHMQMVTYSRQNNGYYPGLTGDGEWRTDHGVAVAAGREVVPVGFRYQLLIEEEYFVSTMLINPAEPTGRRVAWDPESGTPLSRDNYSYASQILYRDIGYTSFERGEEWQDRGISTTPILGDRAVMNWASGTSGTAVKSIYTTPDIDTTNYQGHVAWNDNHVEFQLTNVANTYHGTTVTGNDDLFATAADPNYYSGVAVPVDSSESDALLGVSFDEVVAAD